MKRKIVLIPALIVLAVVLLLLFLHLPFVRTWVLWRAIHIAERSTGASISAASLDYNLFALRLSLNKIVLRRADEPGVPAFFAADRISVKLSPSLLLGRTVHIRDLGILNPRIDVRIFANGTSNLPFGAKNQTAPSAKSALPEFILEKATVSGASFLYRDETAPLRVELPDFGLEAGRTGGGVHSLALRSRKSGVIEYQGRRLPLSALGLEAELGRSHAVVKRLAVASEPHTFFLAGRVNNLMDPVLDLDLEGRISLPGLDQILQTGGRLAGEIGLEFRVEGPLASPEARGTIQSDHLSYEELQGSALRAEFLWQQDALTVPSFEMRVGGGKVAGRGSLRAKEAKVALNWEAVDPAPFLRLAGRPLPLSTRTTGTASVSWTGGPASRIQATARADFSGRGAPVSATEPLPLSGRIRAEIEPGNMSFALENITLGVARLDGGLSIRNGRLRGHYQAEVEDLGKFWPLVRGGLTALKIGAPDLGDVGGRLHLAGRMEGTARRPRVTADITGTGIALAGFERVELDANLSYDRDILRVSPFRVRVGEGLLEIEGAYGPVSPSPLDFRIEARKFPAGDILKTFGLKGFRGGTLEFRGRLSGRPEASVLDFETAVSDFVFEDLEVQETSLKARAELRSERTRFGETSGLRIEAETVRLRTSGLEFRNSERFSVSFGGDGLTVKGMELRDVETQAITLRADGHLPLSADSGSEMRVLIHADLEPILRFFPMRGAQGKLALDAEVRGSLRKPRIQATAELTDGLWNPGEGIGSLEALHASLEIAGDAVRIRSLSLAWGRGRYELRGEVPFESLPFRVPSGLLPGEQRPAHLLLSVSRFHPSDLRGLLKSDILDMVGGEVDVDVEIAAERLAPESLSAAARFTRFDLDFRGVPLIMECPAEWRFENGRLSAETACFRSGENRLWMEGGVDLLNGRDVDFRLRGSVDVRLLEAFLEDGSVSGTASLGLAVGGRLSGPTIEGFLELNDAELDIPAPGIRLGRLGGRVDFGRNRLTIAGISGELNGGKIRVEGEVDYDLPAFKSADIRLRADGVFFDQPEGFYSESSARLRFASDGMRHSLSGNLSLSAAEYVEDINLQSGILGFFRRRGMSDLRGRRRGGFLNNLNLDIRVEAPGSISVRNNLLRADLTANLRLLGTPYQPGLSGRIQFNEGGEVYFSRRTYQVERGEVVFLNPARIEPDVNVRAHTRVSGYRIELLLAGNPEDFSARLISDPPLSEPDIISLLLTGKRLTYISDAGLGFISNQALSYVNDALTGQLEKLAEQKLGFQNVTIDAGLVSAQENPETRITVGQQITPEIEIILSQNLSKSQNRTVILNYSPRRDLNLRGMKKDNDAYRLETQHEIRFGLAGGMSEGVGGERRAPTIESVVFEGESAFEEKELRRGMRLGPRKRFDFLVYRRDIERLRRLHEKQGYLNATINARREERNGRLILIYRVDSGTRVDIRYSGAAVPRSLRKRITETWVEGRFEDRIIARAVELLKRNFRSRRYYQAEVRAEKASAADGRSVVHFRISPGPRYRSLEFSFSGNAAFSGAFLASFLKRSRLDGEVFSGPRRVSESLKNFYAEHGFLRAEVGLPRLEFHPGNGTALAAFTLKEGQRYTLGEIGFEGNRALPADRLLDAVKVRTGDIFSPRMLDDALGALRAAYAREGFNRVELSEDIRTDDESATVALHWEIKERARDVVHEIGVSGNAVTGARVIRREIGLNPGEPLDYLKVLRSQKALYDLGIFSQVNYSVIPKETDGPGTEDVDFQRLDFHVVELKPGTLRYGFQFDTETGAGAAGEIVNRNLRGRSELIGSSFNLSRRERGLRGFFRSQHFLGYKINTELFAFVTRTAQPSFVLDRAGLTLQQQVKLPHLWFLSYNYSLERNRVIEAEADVAETDRPMNIGRVSLSLSRDRRDDIMNATRGEFISQSVDFAAPVLGSDVRMIRAFSQLFFVRPIAAGLRYAAGLRLGFEKAVRREVPISERFFAGGGTSIRGFGLAEVGPKSPESGLPVGGDALFILNQELRFPVYRELRGAVFLDVGNVYPRVSDFNPLSTREAAGFGLRLNTPLVLLRLDWGFKLDRRPGEPRSRIHFSIGQAF